MTHAIPEAAIRKKHIAVVGMTGSGKSSTSKLLIEQVAAEGSRVCILDPLKSDWWGLTSNKAGDGPGLPFQILGGPHGHVPLHAGAGGAIGELVATGKLPLSIIDMAGFGPGGLQRFFNDFAPALMSKLRGVLYLVIEEAHEFCPKEKSGVTGESMSVYYAKQLATAGRSKGVRLVVATQRVQALHNAVLSSCETVIVHRVMYPADQEPVAKWLKGSVKDKSLREEIEGSMPNLADGEGWICSGGKDNLLLRMQFPRIQTYDNSATPEDDSHRGPVVTAQVDVKQLRALIGDAVKDAEGNDVEALKARIKELEARPQISDPVVDQALLVAERRRGLEDGYAAATAAIGGKIHGIVKAGDEFMASLREIAESIAAAPLPDQVMVTTHPPASTLKPATRDALIETARHLTRQQASGSGEPMPKAERLVLTALAQHSKGRTKTQIAILTGYASTGGGFNNALSALRSKGRIHDHVGGLITIATAGLEALGSYEPLPRGRALLQHWLGQLGKAERAALDTLAHVYPQALSKYQLAEATGYDAGGGGFNNALSRLRTLELVRGRGELRASEDLFS